MTVRMLIIILLIVMPGVFLLVGFPTHSTLKSALSALISGLIAAFIGAGLDAIGVRLDLWVYVTASHWHAPWPIYIAAGFLQGAIALIHWRLQTRLTALGQVLFVGIAAVALTLQDYAAAAFGPRVQVFSPGIEPAIGDFVVWSLVTSISLTATSMLAGEATAVAVESR